MVQWIMGADSQRHSQPERIMPLPKNLARYLSQINALDLALENPIQGALVRCKTHGAAVRYRQMCYKARQLYQEQTRDFTKWSNLVITFADEDKTTLLISSQGINDIEIVALDGNYNYDPTPIPEHETFAPEPDASPDQKARERAQAMLEGRTVIYTDHDKLPVESLAKRRAKKDLDIDVDESIKNYDESNAPGSFKGGFSVE